MSNQDFKKPLPVAGRRGYVPLPRWSDEEGGGVLLEPGMPWLFAAVFAVFSIGLFAGLALILVLLSWLHEPMREHLARLLQLFLLVSPVLAFFLSLPARRVLRALWGVVYFDPERDVFVKLRWKDRERGRLADLRAVQLCREPDGCVQLNLVSEGPDGEARRHFLFRHKNGAYLRELGDMLAERLDLDFHEGL